MYVIRASCVFRICINDCETAYHLVLTVAPVLLLSIQVEQERIQVDRVLHSV